MVVIKVATIRMEVPKRALVVEERLLHPFKAQPQGRNASIGDIQRYEKPPQVIIKHAR